MKNFPIKFIIASTVALLALAGCSKSDESADNLPVAEPVVTQITAVCDDFSLKNRLNDAVQANLLDTALSRLSGLSAIQMQDMESKVRGQMATVNFDAQSVANTDTGCIADVYITPSAQALSAAENMLAATGTDLASEINAAGGELVAGRIVAKGITYQITDNKAVLDQPSHPIFVAVADLLVTAAGSAQATTGGLASTAAAAGTAAATAVASPKVVERVAPVTQADSATATDTQPVITERRTTSTTAKPVQSAPAQKNQAKPAAKQTAKAEPKKAEPKKAETKTTAKPEPKTTAKAQTNDGVTKTITKSQSTESKTTAQPKQESKPQAKPQAKPEQKSSVPVGEIVIVEGNDTY